MSKAIACLALAGLCAISPVAAQYGSIFSSPGAAEQLRMGVQAYHRGRYSESIALFEKALAYSPSEDLIFYWLGRAYLKSGHEETALRIWQSLLAGEDIRPFLRSKAELVRAARSMKVPPSEYRFAEVARFEGSASRSSLFSRPSSIIPAEDGSLIVVSHGSNSIVALDVRGVVIEWKRGGLAGLDRPFGAIALPDGTLYVSEFNSDRIARISPNGQVKTFGGKGRGPGQLVGPQYLAVDAAGYIYVSDYGNARVVKYDEDGSFVLSFGAPLAGDFEGFGSPSGLRVVDGTVYVADNLKRTVFRFDTSGNYIGELGRGEFHAPEGISLWNGGSALLIADTDRIASLDLQEERVLEVYRSPIRGAKITGAATDSGGNIMFCDFNASSISVISETSLLASGYAVEIERISAEAFPRIQLEVSVRNREGLPIVGLLEGNFHLTERIRTTSQIDEGGKAVVRAEETIRPISGILAFGRGQDLRGARMAVLVERSREIQARAESAGVLIAELYSIAGSLGGRPILVSAGTTAAREAAADADEAIRSFLSPVSGTGRFDLGLRLAAASLSPSSGRDAIVYIGTGAVDEKSFQGVTLIELAALLRNNALRFFPIVTGRASPALRFIAESSGGKVIDASDPAGLNGLERVIGSAPSGRYTISFDSAAEPGFGRAYLSVGVEAYLYKKSGKDELGYYAPLQ